MFSVHCPGHGAPVLLGPDNIEGVENHRGTIVMRWVCWCGGRGAETFDTSSRREPEGASR